MRRDFAVCVGALGLAILLLATFAGLPPSAMASSRPEIVSRAGWKAKGADVSLMKRQVPRSIVIHHTSVRQQPGVSLERKMQSLQSFSMRSGQVGSTPKPVWGDVPYHFYVDSLGRIAEGRDVNFAGDSNTKYDVKDRVQIVLEGDFEKEQPTAQQLASLRQLLAWLGASFKIPPNRITGHGEHASTDCPGKNLKSQLPGLRKSLAEGR